MANLIEITAFNNALDSTGTYATTASKYLINVNKIISVKTLTTPVNTTGVTAITYSVPVNNSETQSVIVVTEARSAVLAAANAALA